MANLSGGLLILIAIGIFYDAWRRNVIPAPIMTLVPIAIVPRSVRPPYLYSVFILPLSRAQAVDQPGMRFVTVSVR